MSSNYYQLRTHRNKKLADFREAAQALGFHIVIINPGEEIADCRHDPTRLRITLEKGRVVSYEAG